MFRSFLLRSFYFRNLLTVMNTSTDYYVATAFGLSAGRYFNGNGVIYSASWVKSKSLIKVLQKNWWYCKSITKSTIWRLICDETLRPGTGSSFCTTKTFLSKCIIILPAHDCTFHFLNGAFRHTSETICSVCRQCANFLPTGQTIMLPHVASLGLLSFLLLCEWCLVQIVMTLAFIAFSSLRCLSSTRNIRTFLPWVLRQ